jgi:hypothetical protein
MAASLTPRPDVADPTPQTEIDVAEALVHLDQVVQEIDRWMPSCRFKIRLLHRLMLYIADLRFKRGRRRCKQCGVAFDLTQAEIDWVKAKEGYVLPTRCQRCRDWHPRAPKRADPDPV